MRRIFSSAVLLALAMAAGPAAGETVSIVSARDNTLFENETGALSNGAGPVFFVGSNSSLNRRRGVIAFDPAGLPADAVIDSVTLTLHLSNASNETPRRIALQRLTAAWGEGSSSAASGSGAASTAGDATWIHASFPDRNWAAHGGDFIPDVRAAADVVGVGFYSWSTDSLAADVRAWIATPESNFGWVLIGEENVASSARRFDTRENGEALFRPILTIHYTPNETPVESTTWSRIKSQR